MTTEQKNTEGSESRRFRTLKDFPQEEIDDMPTNTDEYVPKGDQMILQLFKTEFTKNVLQAQVMRTEKERFPDASEPLSSKVADTGTVELNYNTKSNYINFLQGKIIELYKQLDNTGAIKTAEEMANLRIDYRAAIDNLEKLTQKYNVLKKQVQEKKKDMDLLNDLQTQGREMRKALLIYNHSNSIPPEVLEKVGVDKASPFDDNALTSMMKTLQMELESKGQPQLKVNRTKNAENELLIQEKSRQITQLRNQIRDLKVDQEKMLDQLKVKGLSPKEVESKMNIVKNTYISLTHPNLNKDVY